MRFFPALFGALLITVAVFLFMQSLIQRGKEEGVQLAVHQDVQILRQEKPEEEPEPEQDTPEEPPEEPQMDTLEVMAAARRRRSLPPNSIFPPWTSVWATSIFRRRASVGARHWRPAV